MKKTKQSGQDGRKAKQKKQATPRARGYRKCPADETVIVQITHEDGREWARVPFSRLEHSALKAVCDLRDCTMQELFNEAVATELAGLGVTLPPAPQPGGNAAAPTRAGDEPKPTFPRTPPAQQTEQEERRRRMLHLESEIDQVSAMVVMLGDAVAAAYTVTQRGHHSSIGCGLALIASNLVDDLQNHWDAACDLEDKAGSDQSRDAERHLLLHLQEAASFTHAACLALAARAAFTHLTDWQQMGAACGALATRLSKRVVAIMDAATPPNRQTTPATGNAEVAA